MKKYLFVLILIFLISFISFPFQVQAEPSSAGLQQINARVLPLLWYSTLSAKAGDSIKIYAGIQNNSDLDFKGTATFYVDEKEVAKTNFNSLKDSLREVSAPWIVVSGSHDVQVKLNTNLPSDKTLISYESDKSNLNIERKITVEGVKDATINTVSNIITKVDETVAPLATKVESFKKPTNTITLTSSLSSKKKSSGSVLGAATGPENKPTQTSTTTKQEVPIYYSAFNMLLDALAFLIRNWLWTLGGIIVIILLMRFMGGRGK